MLLLHMLFLFFLIVHSSSSLFFREALFCFASALIKGNPLLHCMFVHFGGGAMKGGVCLLGLTSNINSVSEKWLTAPLNETETTTLW